MLAGYRAMPDISSGETIEPSETPSVIRIVCTMSGGIARGRPAIAAAPTAIIAPEINPPGKCIAANSKPPAVPMAMASAA